MPAALQGGGVRPHRVMVAGKQGKRPVRQDAVEQLPGDRLIVAEHEIGGLLDHQHAGIALFGCAFSDRGAMASKPVMPAERQAGQLRAAGEKYGYGFR